MNEAVVMTRDKVALRGRRARGAVASWLLVAAVHGTTHAGSPAGAGSGDAPATRDPAPASDANTEADDRRLTPRADLVYLTAWQLRDAQVGSRDVRVAVGEPLARGPGYGVGVFQRYAATWLDRGPYLSRSLTLHQFDLMVAGSDRLAPGWSVFGVLDVGYAAELRAGVPWGSAVHGTAAAVLQYALGRSDAIVLGSVYSSSSSLFAVLPILGYVHQREGSAFRLDVQLPDHLRGVYALAPRWELALGAELHSDLWSVPGMHRTLEVERDGVATFVELGFLATPSLRVEARGGLSIDSYRLPDFASDTTRELDLRAAPFAQVQVVLLPD